MTRHEAAPGEESRLVEQPPRPLVLTRDAATLGAVQRLAATVGVEVATSSSPAVRSEWSSPALVVVGSDQVVALAELGLPRRAGVLVVSLAGPTASVPPEVRPTSEELTVWQAAVAVGAERVVRLPADEVWLASRLGDLLADPSGGVVVGVLGAVGGCGTSTLAAGLAVGAAGDGYRVLLVDTDVCGGGIDLLLGAEDEPGSRWPQLTDARGTVAAATLHDVLPGTTDVRNLQVLACARSAPGSSVSELGAEPGDEAVTAVLAGAARGYDVVVLDLGRGQTVPPAAVERADVLVLLVPLRLRAVAAARTLLSRRDLGERTTIVARLPSPGGLDVADLRAALGRPVSLVVPEELDRAGDEERGEPPGLMARSPVGRACRQLLDDLLPHGRAA